jgi:hypothetical protein
MHANIGEDKTAVKSQATISLVRSSSMYIDVIMIRSPYRTEKLVPRLKPHCRSLYLGTSKHCFDGRRYITKLVLPTFDAIEILNEVQDHSICRLELAFDLITDNPHDKETVKEFIEKHLYMPYHKHQSVVHKERTTYWTQNTNNLGKWRIGRGFTSYDDRHCKSTGEVNCVHLELRLQGSQTIKKLKVYELQDLLATDFFEVWRQFLRLYHVDYQLLGKTHLNRLAGTRRKSTQVRNGYNIDGATGNILFHNLSVNEKLQSRSVQSFIDAYGTGRFLKQIDEVEAWISMANSQEIYRFGNSLENHDKRSTLRTFAHNHKD